MNMQTTSDGCKDCTHLVDGRYCLRWRDIVPEDVQAKGCEEFTDAPPF